MAKDLSQQLWHGIPRKEIPWYPVIDEEKCIGCELCYVSCGREVFEFDDVKRKAVVERKFNCMVGCSTCATICPTNAISFPDRELIQKIEREYKILKVVRQKAKEKKTKKEFEEIRDKVMNSLSKISTSIEFELTGHFAEKELMPKLYQAIKDDPCDIVLIHIETPTLKGCWNEKAPSYAKFKLVSTEYSEVKPCVQKLKKVFKNNDIVIVSEKNVV